MTVIFAFVLILWLWGCPVVFESRTGHGNASKIGFLFDAYYAVAWYPRAGRNCEMRFQPAKVKTGLHKSDYQPQGKTVMNTGFFY